MTENSTEKQKRIGRAIYLVKRGPRPEHHRAPFHPVIVTDNRKDARWEAGWSGDGANVWSVEWHHGDVFGGLLLERWNGLDIDYGHIVRGHTLPDGMHSAFHHPHAHPETWALFQGAVWWSEKPLPDALARRGVVEAPDDFSRQTIRTVRGYREFP